MFFLYYVLFAFFTFIVATVAAFVYLDWWWAISVSLITMLTLVQLGGVVLRWRLRRMGEVFQGLFKVKSQVLKGANIHVHSVTRAAPPTLPLLESDQKGEAEEDETPDVPAPPQGPLAWYCIDLTIEPVADPGPMQHWDVSDLRLIAGNARVPANLDEREEEPDFELHEIEIEDGEQGRFRMAEEGKYAGRQRLRFLVGLPSELREVKFRYYFEEFGRIVLPGK
jgi:hypothetical protein